MRVTKRQLRRIVKEERRRLLREFSYSEKLELLHPALEALTAVQKYEAMHSQIGEDPDLNALIDHLEGYMDAVQAMVAMEG